MSDTPLTNEPCVNCGAHEGDHSASGARCPIAGRVGRIWGETRFTTAYDKKFVDLESETIRQKAEIAELVAELCAASAALGLVCESEALPHGLYLVGSDESRLVHAARSSSETLLGKHLTPPNTP